MNRVLVLDDDKAVLNYFVVLLAQTRRFEVQALNDSSLAFESLARGEFDLVLLDMDMPKVTGIDVLRHIGQHHPGTIVIVITGVGDVELAVQAMKLGAHDYLCKPVDSARLVACIDRALQGTRAREELRGVEAHEHRPRLRSHEALTGIVTQDRKLLATLATVEQIAHSENNVLVYGESGTGKELVARAIHQIGRRAQRPFVAVNAAAFASALFDSHFFGHERGAFTGAELARTGLFEEADGGTLFLDEIGDIEAPVQSKLLRVLQSGEYFRLGSTKKRDADVRIVSATNKDIDVEVAQGRFRRDLYHRLNISSIFLPPLRARRGDIELLSYHFLERYCTGEGRPIRSIPEPVMELLHGYEFPGNVRELENLIAGAVVLETGDKIGLRSLPPYLLRAAASRDLRVPSDVRKALADVEAEHIRAVVEHTHGNRSAAARILGISRVSLLARLKRLGIAGAPARAGDDSVDPS